MGYNCKTTEVILALIIIIFSFMSWSSSKWVIIVAAVLLLIHAFSCKDCGACKSCDVPKAKATTRSPRKSSKKRKRR